MSAPFWMLTSDDLGAVIARLSLMQASGELDWLPGDTVSLLEALHARQVQVEACVEADDLIISAHPGLVRSYMGASDVYKRVQEVVSEVACAYSLRVRPPLPPSIEATATLPSGHQVKTFVHLHRAVPWMLATFGPVAAGWLKTEGTAGCAVVPL